MERDDLREDAYAPPRAPRAADDRSPHAAGLGLRGVARAIDAIVVAASAFSAVRTAGLVLAWLVRTKSIRPGWEDRLASPSVVVLLTLAILPIVHDVVAEAIGGASIGKLVMGLRVRDGELFAVTSGMALRRALAMVVDVAFVGPFLVWKTGERLGDRWAGAIVVRSSDVVGDELGRALAGGFLAPLAVQIVATFGYVVAVL